MSRTSKRVQDLAAEIMVHGLDKALEVLGPKYSAEEWTRAAGAAPAEEDRCFRALLASVEVRP